MWSNIRSLSIEPIFSRTRPDGTKINVCFDHLDCEFSVATSPERAGREGDSQGLPTINDERDIQSRVIEDIEARREVGIKRYGTALQPNNGRDALLDAYEEALDLTMYLKQALVERQMREHEEHEDDLVEIATEPKMVVFVKKDDLDAAKQDV